MLLLGLRQGLIWLTPLSFFGFKSVFLIANVRYLFFYAFGNTALEYPQLLQSLTYIGGDKLLI